MSHESQIQDVVRDALAKYPSASDDTPRLLLTAGPTVEDIDPVRFITNRSSGRMGIALAIRAAARDWSTLLILGATHLPPPAGIACVRVRSAAEMHTAVLAAFVWCDALVMTAAVADYTPASPITRKLKKYPPDQPLTITLTRTRDILLDTSTHPTRAEKIIIGFSLDTSLDMREGKRKLREKNLDAILVNTTDSFNADHITAKLLGADDTERDLGSVSKSSLADTLLDYLAVVRKQGG